MGFANMLTTDADGVVWQNEAVCRSYTECGKDYSADGKPALWEDEYHSTPAGATQHFQCVVQALKVRWFGGSPASPAPPLPTHTTTQVALSSQVGGDRPNVEWQQQQEQPQFQQQQMNVMGARQFQQQQINASGVFGQ